MEWPTHENRNYQAQSIASRRRASGVRPLGRRVRVGSGGAVGIEGQVQASGSPLANSTVTLWQASARASRPSKVLHISRFRLHALQKAKRVERANGDQFEAHHMCFTQRQLFEHFVSDGRIGDVDDERHARLSL
jgi:hypothetical protein